MVSCPNSEYGRLSIDELILENYSLFLEQLTVPKITDTKGKLNIYQL